MVNLTLLTKQAQKEVEKIKDLKELDSIFRKYLGKRGEIRLLLVSLKGLKKEKRAKIGKEINEAKNFLKEKIDKKIKELRLRGTSTKELEAIDVTAPGKKPHLGHL